MVAAGEDPARLRSWTVLAPLDAAREKTAGLCSEILGVLGKETPLISDAIDVRGEQLGPGYGISTDPMTEAVRLLARTEGLLVDPVYGGKALAGLMAAIRAGEFAKGDAVLFLMTGGTPGLFVYRDSFQTAGA